MPTKIQGTARRDKESGQEFKSYWNKSSSIGHRGWEEAQSYSGGYDQTSGKIKLGLSWFQSSSFWEKYWLRKIT